MSNNILKIEDLVVSFKTKYGKANAVNSVNFELAEGEKLGIVGESGSGKSVTAKSIMRLLQSPPAHIEGSITFHDKNLLELDEIEMCKYRGNQISMIFQEPMVCLNPLFTIGNQMAEVIMLHEKCSKQECEQRLIDMLKAVGIPSPETRLKQYPFELSGGMRQRVMIAMSLLCKPEILIADEPTTALDVTIQAQILELLCKLNDEMGTALILITHDLGVIAETVDRVIVMYAGSVIEIAPVNDLFDSPMHPYTQGLIASLPKMHSDTKVLQTIEGNVPSIYNLPDGCAFHNRCKYAEERCKVEAPPMISKGGRSARCFRAEEWNRG